MLYSYTHTATVGVKGLIYTVTVKKTAPKQNAVKCTIYNTI